MQSQTETSLVQAPLTGAKLVMGSFAVALATFMNVLDSSIANVAIPTISGNLGVSVDEGTWVITLFAAANAVAIPLTGWLTQRVGQVRLFVGAILLFVLSSWLCGLAPPDRPAGRAHSAGCRGGTADPAIAVDSALLVPQGKERRRDCALGDDRHSRAHRGPALGGWMTDSYSWSWIFYINVPVGLFAAAVTWAIYRDRETATRKLPIDLVGLASLITWVASLQIMLDKGKDLDWFSSPVIVTLAIVALLSFLFFVIWELTETNPVIDLRLFKGRNFLAGTVAISVAFAVFFANLVVLPQWMQQYLAYPAVTPGWRRRHWASSPFCWRPWWARFCLSRNCACSPHCPSSALRLCSSCAPSTPPAWTLSRLCCPPCCKAFRPRCSSSR